MKSNKHLWDKNYCHGCGTSLDTNKRFCEFCSEQYKLRYLKSKNKKKELDKILKELNIGEKDEKVCFKKINC